MSALGLADAKLTNCSFGRGVSVPPLERDLGEAFDEDAADWRAAPDSAATGPAGLGEAFDEDAADWRVVPDPAATGPADLGEAFDEDAAVWRAALDSAATGPGGLGEARRGEFSEAPLLPDAGGLVAAYSSGAEVGPGLGERSRGLKQALPMTAIDASQQMTDRKSSRTPRLEATGSGEG